jgi:endonuclease/exonuclease/phosphatase family metal-dependent hydrolase
MGRVLFASTHLSWRAADGPLRLRQVEAALAALERRGAGRSHPTILVGDFNAISTSAEMRLACERFVDAFAAVGTGPSFTWDRANDHARMGSDPGEPDRRIDYVLVHRAGGAAPVGCHRAFDVAEAPGFGTPAVFASDHFGVCADVHFSSAISERFS